VVDNDPVRMRMGLILMEQKNYDGAIADFSAIVSRDPGNDKARYFLGLAHEGKKDWARCLAELEKIPSGSELFTEARIHMAYVYEEQGNLNKAIEVIEGTLREKSDDLVLYKFLGSLLERAKRYEERIALMQKALQLDSESEDVNILLGVLYEKAVKLEDSINAMEKVLRINPDNADALNYIGYTYAEQGVNLDRAEELVKKELRLKPRDGYIIDSLGWVYFKKGDYKKAVRHLEEAESYASEDPLIKEHLGDAYLEADFKDRALEMYEKALSLEPGRDELKKKIEALRGRLYD
jgi:tetratricopeptide (TPR) repeat protein